MFQYKVYVPVPMLVYKQGAEKNLLLQDGILLHRQPLSQIYEQTLISEEWKSAIKCSLFSIVVWKHILKSDLDFWTLILSCAV